MTLICNMDEIAEGKAKEFEVNKESLIIARSDGEIYAYINRCPHLGIPLNWQPDDFMDEEAGLLRCSTHGALFLVQNGECVSGPCLGESLQRKNLRTKNNQILAD